MDRSQKKTVRESIVTREAGSMRGKFAAFDEAARGQESRRYLVSSRSWKRQIKQIIH